MGTAIPKGPPSERSRPPLNVRGKDQLQEERDQVTTVTRGSGPHQSGGTTSTDNALIGGLLLVTVMSIGALLCIVLSGGNQMDNVATVAITTIGGIALAAISAIAVVLRKRLGSRSRRS